MITQGSEIFNLKTRTKHIVDEIEIINNEKLVFTKDVKCFPIKEVKLLKTYDEEDENLEFLKKILYKKKLNYDGYVIPKPIQKLEPQKNIFSRVWKKILSVI